MRTHSRASSPSAATEAYELAELFCRQARRRAETLFAELWDNDDDENRAAAAKVLDGRYRWFEDGVLDPSGEGPMIPDEVRSPPESRANQATRLIRPAPALRGRRFSQSVSSAAGMGRLR